MLSQSREGESACGLGFSAESDHECVIDKAMVCGKALTAAISQITLGMTPVLDINVLSLETLIEKMRDSHGT